MELVFASNNKHKIKEVQLMVPPSIKILSLDDIGCVEDIPETANTIEGNATLKANFIVKNYGYDCFADDTGLEVDALNGEPGVFSARYAGEHRSAADNMDKLLHKLQNRIDRSAQFKTVIALILGGKQHLFTGIVRGEITMERAGTEGFGYDPIFKADGHSATFAQLSAEEKAAISHRGRAVRQLIAYLGN